MKNLISKFVIVVAFMCATSVNAQNNPQFETALGTCSVVLMPTMPRQY